MTASATSTAARYRLLPSERRVIEEEVLGQWEHERLFERTLERSSGHGVTSVPAPTAPPEWVFYEGPPTANGRPGIHHVFARTVKDLFCRHRTMLGFHVARKAGWDTHGLPVEIEVEKELGIKNKAEIEKFGVEKFNERCRESVFRYRSEWEKLSQRIGYWLDYANPYVTFTADYVESVWWALKTLHERGLLYSGHKILPYCPRCETALSSHELASGYRDVTDPSVYIALELEGGERRILVWTTTPWTLVSNVALAVNPELHYVEVRKRTGTDHRTLILSKDRVSALLGDDYDTRWDVVRELRGKELVGLTYRRPFDWVPYGQGAHEVIVGESFVTAEDGSGVVHMAPAFGADDYAAGKRHGLAFLQPVDSRGAFHASVPEVGGVFVKEADTRIIEILRERGILWKSLQFEHSYPHCWRCSTPLLYYARSSYFVRSTAVRESMLSRNAQVDWHPAEVGAGRFGEWLAGNVDWAISRDRYWGTPLPVWRCEHDAEHVQVIGSYAELRKHVGENAWPEKFDPHKPYVDHLTWKCEHCSGTMRRLPEVIDTWFDSGSMPFAQWHYPFENRELVARRYPADFIAEGVDQTRGWFYSLLAIASGLGDALPNNTDGQAAPYRTVVVNDLVLDANGQKMSKSKGNAVDPWTVIEGHGVDAIRLFLVASSQIWVPRRFDEQAIRDTAGRFLVTLKNMYDGMFATYANFGWEPSPLDPAPKDRSVLDRWVLSRLASVEKEVDGLLRAYDATLAVRAIMNFVDDDVSKWYVRLSRSRFYDVDQADNRAAFATLHEVLTVSCRLLAPVAPFITDWVHRELTGESVHLAPFVRPELQVKGEHHAALEAAMNDIRQLSTLGRAAREEAKIKTRQPLSRLVCVAPRTEGRVPDAALLAELTPLLAAELNVKHVEWASSGDALVSLVARPNFRSLGKKFGKHTPLAAAAVSALPADRLRAFEKGEPIVVTVESESHHLDAEDISISHVASGELAVQESNGYVAAIDPRLTPELEREGLARELISVVQRIRKESKFAVSDRITLELSGDDVVEQAFAAHRDWIRAETLATAASGANLPPEVVRTLDLDGHTVRIALTRE